MKHLDWNGLKIFLAIAEARNLMSAAESLGMSHSTIYRRLNDFEEEVGRLFERINGAYELTELGEEMLLQGKSISHSFENIERHIAGQDLQLKGLVKITTPSSFAYHFLPNKLAEFKALYPDIQLEILVTDQEVNMNNRQADIALRVTSNPPEHLVGREILKIQWGVYAHPAYCQISGTPYTEKDLMDHKIIGAAGLLRNHPTFAELDKKFVKTIDIRTDDLVAMASFANQSHGLAILPDDLAQPDLKRLFTYKAAPDNHLWVLTHPDLRKIERIKVVMKFLTESFAENIFHTK